MDALHALVAAKARNKTHIGELGLFSINHRGTYSLVQGRGSWILQGVEAKALTTLSIRVASEAGSLSGLEDRTSKR